MLTARRWYALLLMVIASVFLVLLAGNLEDWRTPEELVPLPLVAVGILGSAISLFVLSLGYAVIVIFGGPTQTVPRIMLGLVALLATACALMTGLETLGHHEHIAHSYPGLLIVVALGYAAVAIWLAVIFSHERVADEEYEEEAVDQVETMRRPGAAPFRPETTLEM